MVIPVIRRAHRSHGNLTMAAMAIQELWKYARVKPSVNQLEPLCCASWAWEKTPPEGGETKITQSPKPGFGESHKKVWFIPCSNSFKIFTVFLGTFFFLTLALPSGNQLHGLLEISHLYRSMMISYGGFLNWGYPQIIQISTIFVLNPMVLGTLI